MQKKVEKYESVLQAKQTHSEGKIEEIEEKYLRTVSELEDLKSQLAREERSAKE